MKHWLKRLLRWDARSDYEKSIVLYRLRYKAARALSPFGLGLERLLQLAGTDKHRPKEARGHRYGRAYAEALRRWRWRRVRILEIGIGGGEDDAGGRSLLTWVGYFPRGRVIACDLQDRSALAATRVQIRQMDQGDPDDLRRIAAEGPFDVIIDDGSHLSAHQLTAFSILFDALVEDGLYILEDVQTSYWHRPVGGVEWDGAPPRSPAFAQTCVGHFLELAKHLNYAEFVDPDDADPALLADARRVRRIAFEHNLILITKGANDALSNTVGVAA